MRTEDIKRLMEAYNTVVSEKKVKEEKEECSKCKGEGCEHCDGKGYHEVSEAKHKGKKEALDPVDDKEVDKKFKDRKDKDIDNDGDVDDSDEYLHKRRAATDDAIDARKGKKDDKKKKPAGNDGEKTAEISKIGEKVTTKEDVDKLLEALNEMLMAAVALDEKTKADQTKGELDGEKIDDKEAPKSKKFADLHKVDVTDEEETHQTATDAGRAGPNASKRPGDNPKGDKKVVNPVKVKEDTRSYREKIMDILNGKTMSEIAELEQDVE